MQSKAQALSDFDHRPIASLTLSHMLKSLIDIVKLKLLAHRFYIVLSAER